MASGGRTREDCWAHQAAGAWARWAAGASSGAGTGAGAVKAGRPRNEHFEVREKNAQRQFPLIAKFASIRRIGRLPTEPDCTSAV